MFWYLRQSERSLPFLGTFPQHDRAFLPSKVKSLTVRRTPSVTLSHILLSSNCPRVGRNNPRFISRTSFTTIVMRAAVSARPNAVRPTFFYLSPRRISWPARKRQLISAAYCSAPAKTIGRYRHDHAAAVPSKLASVMSPRLAGVHGQAKVVSGHAHAVAEVTVSARKPRRTSIFLHRLKDVQSDW
jgi:hypothetical protein